MTLSKIFKITERINLKFDANAFNIFNRTNFVLATQGGGAHNQYAHFDPNAGPLVDSVPLGGLVATGNFGRAAGTLNSRNMQFGLKLSF